MELGNSGVLVLLTKKPFWGVIWHYLVKLSICNSMMQQFCSRCKYQINSHTDLEEAM